MFGNKNLIVTRPQWGLQAFNADFWALPRYPVSRLWPRLLRTRPGCRSTQQWPFTKKAKWHYWNTVVDQYKTGREDMKDMERLLKSGLFFCFYCFPLNRRPTRCAITVSPWDHRSSCPKLSMTSLRTKAPTSCASCGCVSRRAPSLLNSLQVPLLGRNLNRILPKTSCFSHFPKNIPRVPLCSDIISIFLQYPPSFIMCFFMCSSVPAIFLPFSINLSHNFSSCHIICPPENVYFLSQKCPPGPSAHQGPERRQRSFGRDHWAAVGPRGEDHGHRGVRVLGDETEQKWYITGFNVFNMYLICI